MTAAEELTLIDAALTALYTGGVSSYTINGRGVTKLDLAKLLDRKRELGFVVARTSTGGGCPVAQFRPAE